MVEVTPLGALGASLVLFLAGWIGNLALNRSRESRDHIGKLADRLIAIEGRLQALETEVRLTRPAVEDVMKRAIPRQEP